MGNYIQYDSYDVCDSVESLTRVIERLSLDKRYNQQSNLSIKEEEEVEGEEEVEEEEEEESDEKHETLRGNKPTFSTVLFISIHLNVDLTDFLKIVFQKQIPILEIGFEVLADGAIYSSDIEQYTGDLVRLVKYFNWHDLFLVSIVTEKSEYYPYHALYERTTEVLRDMKKCLHLNVVTSLHPKATNLLFTLSWLQNRRPVIILFGKPANQLVVFHRLSALYKKTGVQIVLHDVEISFDSNDIARGMNGYITILNKKRNMKFTIINDVLSEETHAMIEEVPLFVQKGFDYNLNVILKYEALHASYGEETALDLRNQRRWIINSENIFTGTEVEWSSDSTLGGVFKKSLEYDGDPGVKVNRTDCPVMNCTPGHYRVYGSVSNGFAFKCVKCPKNHYKVSYGSKGCQKCTGITYVANSNHTGCMDPYADVSPELFIVEFIFVLIFSGICLVSTVCAMAIFSVEKNSPVVASSDFRVSMLHMGVICSISMLLPTLYLVDAVNIVSCILKPVLISTLYVVNIGIVFVKSQKLLRAFTSKIRITGEEARKTIGLQFFTIILFLITTNGVLALCTYQNTPEVLSVKRQHDTRLLRVRYCNTYQHSNVVLIVAMFIQAMCFVQAFRSRHLPSIMNDALSLTYTAFTLTVVFAVSFAIVHFQTPVHKDVFQSMAVTLNNLVIFTLLYGQRCIRMLCYPHKNTRTYFQKKRMEAINQKLSTA